MRMNAPNTVNGYCNSNVLESTRIAISKVYSDSQDVVILLHHSKPFKNFLLITPLKMALFKQGWNQMRLKHHLSSSQVSNYGTKQQWVPIQASQNAIKTVNPIRKLMDNLTNYKISENKELISVAIGDPTRYIPPPDSIKLAVKNAYDGPNTVNSYCNSNGLDSARIAISKLCPNCTKDDVVITCGCQGALDFSFYSLCNSNLDNILIPAPGWPEYETNLNKYDFGYKYYNCLPDKQWQIDTKHLESLIDENTKAILTNNPSNPCGSILDYDTICNVLTIAEKYKLPIISDEIYSNIIFPGENNKFYTYSEIKQKEGLSAPIIITSGLGKNYLVPGWKVGWIIFDDYNCKGSLDEIKKGIGQLTQVNYGPSSLCQSMIPDILDNTDSEFWVELSQKIYENSKFFSGLINDNIPELHAIPGRGAFYMMIKIHFDKLKDIDNDYQFFEKFLAEQAVFILPGSIFKMDGYFRAVICATDTALIEVADRLKEFCEAHRI